MRALPHFWYAVFRFSYRTQYAKRRNAVSKNLVISYADFYIKFLQFSSRNAINATHKVKTVNNFLRTRFARAIFLHCTVNETKTWGVAVENSIKQTQTS